MAQAQPRMPVESGVPDHFQYMHPALRRNYGMWAWHDRPRPGVLHHVSETGEEVWTVRAGTQRQLDVDTVRKLCDIADEFADGHMRFTIRSARWSRSSSACRPRDSPSAGPAPRCP